MERLPGRPLATFKAPGPQLPPHKGARSQWERGAASPERGGQRPPRARGRGRAGRRRAANRGGPAACVEPGAGPERTPARPPAGCRQAGPLRSARARGAPRHTGAERAHPSGGPRAGGGKEGGPAHRAVRGSPGDVRGRLAVRTGRARLRTPGERERVPGSSTPEPQALTVTRERGAQRCQNAPPKKTRRADPRCRDARSLPGGALSRCSVAPADRRACSREA